MTIPDAPPDWPRIARYLLHRAEKARDTWHTPAHRLAASSDALAAAQHTDIDNAQILGAIGARHGWPGRTRVGADSCQASIFIALHADQRPQPAEQTAPRPAPGRAPQRGDPSPMSPPVGPAARQR
ncbi:hypothetical protein GCM10010266_74310 [Streptomyces griseomycini]|nr:hypothetical protein GCM10010266_74310 [Streptomyces griseomycini]GGR60856.1 hypothetical protein GCM10015536_76170 [Streptomyces griseomycini]